MVKVDWTEIALNDLKEIHEYISKDSIHFAAKFIEKILERVNQLENFPKSGRVVPEFNNQSLRELIEGSFRIIYKIKTIEVFIVRVHHSSRRLK